MAWRQTRHSNMTRSKYLASSFYFVSVHYGETLRNHGNLCQNAINTMTVRRTSNTLWCHDRKRKSLLHRKHAVDSRSASCFASCACLKTSRHFCISGPSEYSTHNAACSFFSPEMCDRKFPVTFFPLSIPSCSSRNQQMMRRC